MPRKARIAPPGYIYHVSNRAAGRSPIFRKEEDFAVFEQALLEAHKHQPIPILAYCVMGNHWHFVVRPTKAGQMANFFRWLTLTHAVRWRVAHRNLGSGRLYRGRFKAFPVQAGPKLLELLRYVERSPFSAGLVRKAQNWQHSSLGARLHGPKELRQLLSDPPVARPSNWTSYVNQPIPQEQLTQLETSEQRSRPYGDDAWVIRIVAKLGLEHTFRPIGRPRTSPPPQPRKSQARRKRRR